MKYIALVAIFLVALIDSSLQQTVVVPEDSNVVEFMVQVERLAPVPGGHNLFLGVGTLLTFQHVLTTRDIYVNLTVPRDITFRFRSARLGEGFRAAPVQVVQHAQANMAIGRMAQRVDQQFSFAPRHRGVLTMNRFCTMHGFNVSPAGVTAQSLVMTGIVVRNGTEFCAANPPGPFCATGTVGQFPLCSGFIGASVTCDGQTVSGLVVQDNFCAALQPRVFMIALNEFEQWLDDQTSGVKGVVGGLSVAVTVVGVLISRIFV